MRPRRRRRNVLALGRGGVSAANWMASVIKAISTKDAAVLVLLASIKVSKSSHRTEKLLARLNGNGKAVLSDRKSKKYGEEANELIEFVKSCKDRREVLGQRY